MGHIIHPFMPILQDCEDEIYTAYKQVVSEEIFCDEIRTKIMSARIYFALLLFNILFIVYTTSYYIYRIKSAKWYALLSPTPATTTWTATTAEKLRYNISKQWQTYSLGKRGLFGYVLGALGHLVFTTFVITNQVFVGDYTCEFYLWGPFVGFYIWTYAIVWRALRLHLLIRVNELQRRYLSSATKRSNRTQQQLPSNTSHTANVSVYTTSSSKMSAKEDKDYTWFMRHKDTLNLSTTREVLHFLATLLVIVVIIIIVETTYIRPPHSYHSKARCKYLYGNMLNVAMVVGFFILIVPSVVWYLRRDKDAHGIRKEIMITMGVGTPCLVMTIVWQLVFDPPTRKTPSSIRNIYGPMNWLMVVTTTNHIVSIIWPLFKKIPLTTLSTRNTSIMDLLLPRKKTIQRRQQQQQPQQQQNGLLANQQKSKCWWWYPCSNNKALFHTKDLNSDPLYDMSRNTTAATTLPTYQQDDPVVELTTESLTQALLNPKMLRVLQTWAVKDFSVENILFYEKYIEFTQKIQEHISNSLTHHSPQPTTSTPDHYTNDSKMLNTPFGIELMPELVEFYNTFIADQAPLQINISFAAREKIDAAFAPLVREWMIQDTSNNNNNQSSDPNFLKQPSSSSSPKQQHPQKLFGEFHETIVASSPSSPPPSSANNSTLTNSKKFTAASKTNKHLNWLLDTPPPPVVRSYEPFECILPPHSAPHDMRKPMPIATMFSTKYTVAHPTSTTTRTTTTNADSTPTITLSISNTVPTVPVDTNTVQPALAPSSRIASVSSLHSIPSSNITLQLFEQARKEVFWNIFSGLFPKVVAAYRNHPSSEI